MKSRRPLFPLVRSATPRTLRRTSSNNVSVPFPPRPWNEAQTAFAVVGVLAVLGIWAFAD